PLPRRNRGWTAAPTLSRTLDSRFHIALVTMAVDSPSRSCSTVTASAKRTAATMAERADIHELYEAAVQAVDVEVEFLRDTFKALRGREPKSFREDFCGTASAAFEWVRVGKGKRHAIGVVIDAD